MKSKQLKLNYWLLVLAIVLGSLLQGAVAQDEKPFTTLKIDDDLTGELEAGEEKHYVLELEAPQQDDQYLIVTAEGTFEGSEPDIYIRTKEKTTLKNSEVICKSYGFALCHVKKSQISGAKKLFIAVKCPNKCGYELTAFIEESKSKISMRLNDLTYAIFEDSKGSTNDKRQTLEKVVQMSYSKNDLSPDEELINMLLEFELMNPVESYTTFNVFFNFNDQVPTRARCHSWGLNWGSGSGMGVFVQNKNQQSFLDEGVYTMTIEAHEGAIIAVRAYGWGEVRYIRPFQLVGGFTVVRAQEMKYSLSIDKNRYKGFNEKDLIIGLVPFQGDPNLFADYRPFSDLKSVALNNYQWVSNEFLDDRITITPRDLAANETVNIVVNSQDPYSLFTLRAYYPLGKTPLSFDYPESGSLTPNEVIIYSLSLYGSQVANVTLTLKPKEGNPGLVFKRCDLEEKEKCFFTEDDYKNTKVSKFGQEQVIFKFTSNPSECSSMNFDGLQTCYYIIGVRNPDPTNEAKFTLLASNGLTHTILQEDETYHEGAEFGKINYYMMNLTQYTNVTQVSFQLSNVQGSVSMFTSFDTIRPNINDKTKQSFTHSLHLYAEESGTLNRAVYLGIQSDSAFASYNLQAKVIDDANFSYYVLEENNPILVTEDANKVKKVHFKLYLRKGYGQDLKVKIMLEPLSGYYDMKIGQDPEHIDEMESTSNTIDFSSKQFNLNKYETPIYGIITPRMTWLNSKIQFKLSYVTGSVIHQTLNLGMVNQIRATQSEQYFKIPIHSNEQIIISKNVMNQYGEQNDAFVVVSYDQSNVKPKKGELNVIEIPSFTPQVIVEENFKLHCKKIDEFSVENNNCFLFVTVSAEKETLILLYADINAGSQYIFTDFPNVVAIKPQSEKLLYYPDLFNKQFNLFKTATFHGDSVTICAKIFNNTVEKSKWAYPIGCKSGDYDFIFNTQDDENYFFEVQEDNKVCDFNKKQCGLSIYIKDTKYSLWSETDQISLTLQQSHTTLHPGQSLIDSLPPNSARFYYVELSEVKDKRFIIAATEYIDESLELVLYIDTQKVHSTNKGLPYIAFDKDFREQLKQKKITFNNNSQFGLEVKSKIKDKNIKYSVLLTLSSAEKEVNLNNINLGKPSQIQLQDNEDYQYFVFKNKEKGKGFKIVLSQQTQGYTQITVDYLGPKQSEQLPLKKYIHQTYENVLAIQETDQSCQKQCSYIIQLHTTEVNGASLSLSVVRDSIILLENISALDELKQNDRVTYTFNSLNKSTLSIDLQSGSISFQVLNSEGKSQYTEKISTSGLYTYTLDPLSNINQSYIVNITANIDSKLNIKFVNENTYPQLAFDTPLKNQSIQPGTQKNFAIQNSGDKIINIQLQFMYQDKQFEIGTIFDEMFESSERVPIPKKLISNSYDQNTGLYIHHLQIHPTKEMTKILMGIKNYKKNPITKLTIYISQNFTLLDHGVPMFYYFDGVHQLSNLYGIILPEKERKIFIEITCLKGEIRAEGTYQRDSALNNQFQFTFSSGVRQTLEVDVNTANFYIKLQGLEKNTQGYVKFISLSKNTPLPTNILRKPVRDSPIITGVKSTEKWGEYSQVHFQFDPLDCSHFSDLKNFELKGILYTMIIAQEKQLAYGTDIKFSQIAGDFTSIKQSIDLYNNNNSKEENNQALFFSFNEESECYKSCSQCKTKELSVPLDNASFKNYIDSNTTSVIVRASVTWRHPVDHTEYQQNIYYNEVIFDQEAILPPIPEEKSGISTVTIVLIILGTFVLIALVVFYFRKYKQTEKKLNFELTDVRNVANLSSSHKPIADQHLKHIPLDEEIQE